MKIFKGYELEKKAILKERINKKLENSIINGYLKFIEHVLSAF